MFTRHGDRTPAFWAAGGNSIGSQQCSAAEQSFWDRKNHTLHPSVNESAEWQKWCPYDPNQAILRSLEYIHDHSYVLLVLSQVKKRDAGTLTRLGAATQLANGIWLRERYVTALGVLNDELTQAAP